MFISRANREVQPKVAAGPGQYLGLRDGLGLRRHRARVYLRAGLACYSDVLTIDVVG